jgi:hypothetical protein
MSTESYVQVAPDSTGAKVRNVTVTEPIAAATPDLPDIPTSVHQQVVVLADTSGSPIDFDALRSSIDDLHTSVVALTELVKLAL